MSLLLLFSGSGGGPPPPTMDTFDFYHTVRTVYPDNSARVTFGGAYEFVSRPNSPDQRIFVLNFSSMKFFFNGDDTLNAAVNTKFNYKTFRNFYEAHRLWDKFIYPHPEFGNIVVRFHKPLEDPEWFEGGNGASKSFQIELIEQP